MEDLFHTDEVDMQQEMVWNAQPFESNARQPIMALQSEILLIHAAQKGDVSAFNRLVLDYQDGLYRWAVSLVSDEMLADDITQWTFMTAYEKLSTFRGGSLRAWLFRIARNRSFDELRYRRKHTSVSLGESPDDDGDWFDVVADKRPLPEDELVKVEQAALIENLLNRLPDMFHQILRLVDMEGMDYQEAADVLNLPIGTVKSRLARARIKLRDLYKKQDHQFHLRFERRDAGQIP